MKCFSKINKPTCSHNKGNKAKKNVNDENHIISFSGRKEHVDFVESYVEKMFSYLQNNKKLTNKPNFINFDAHNKIFLKFTLQKAKRFQQRKVS